MGRPKLTLEIKRISRWWEVHAGHHFLKAFTEREEAEKFCEEYQFYDVRSIYFAMGLTEPRPMSQIRRRARQA